MTTHEFRLGIGGPLHRVERATHIDAWRRLVLAAIGITWVPLLVFSLAQWVINHRGEPMLRDLSIHVRLVVTLPVLLLAERLLDGRCKNAVRRLFGEGFVPADQEGRVRAILQSAERWRDSPAPEAIIFGLAVAVGVASLLGVIPPAGFVSGVAASRYSLVRLWYALVSLPIFSFVLWRSLFRWGLWVRVLAGLSRVPLRLLPTHADRRGGIDFLKRPSISYCALLLLASSSALCGGFATQIVLYGKSIDTFKPLLFTFVIIGAVIAFAPLLTFLPQLHTARRWGRAVYGGLVTDYSRELQERWIEKPRVESPLGSPDFQSLADLSSSYQENVEKMQILLFSPRDAIVLFIISQIPAIPILLTQLPGREVLKRLLHLFTGGMPG
jgi:hypothetical protein